MGREGEREREEIEDLGWLAQQKEVEESAKYSGFHREHVEFKMTLAVTRIWVVGWGIGSRIREGSSSEFG